MSMTALPIGEAARQSGVKAPTIRYYEQIGLLPAPPRSEGNRRQYDTDDLRRLAFILLIPEEAAPQFLDDAAPHNGMMPPPDSEMIAPPISE